MKPRAGFLKAQLNCERLTPIQWDGIMRAMDNYAVHYHEEKSKSKKESKPMEREQDSGNCNWDYLRST